MSTVANRLRFPVALAALVLLVALFVPLPTAQAATVFVVDTVVYDYDLDACTDNAGDCSLAGAMEAANDNPGADSIVFDIPAAQCPDGVCKIRLGEGGSLVTEAVTIDATTQPQGSGPQANVCATETSSSRMRVELLGGEFAFVLASEGPGDPGPSGVTIRGFALTGDEADPPFAAIMVDDSSGVHIACNHIGVGATGTSASPLYHEYGILIANSHDVIIGTNGDGVDDVGEGNLFGPADDQGGSLPPSIIGIYESNANWIAGNTFGVGGPYLSDGWSVLYLEESSNTLIGTDENGVSDELERNHFTYGSTFSSEEGLALVGSTRIVGNTFGITPDGEILSGLTFPAVDLYLESGSTDYEIRNNAFGAYQYEAVFVYGEGPLLIAGNTFGGSTLSGPYGSQRALEIYGGEGITIRDNVFRNSEEQALRLDAESAEVHHNCFVGNGEALESDSDVNAENNWYGAIDGPSGVGPGSGDPILQEYGIDFTPWLDSPPEQCNEAPLAGDAEFSVAEDVAGGTVIGTVTATDDGAAALSYLIAAGNPDDVFAIDAATGEITVAGGLDYETVSTYDLMISVADPFAAGTATVTIAVTDVYELPTTPTFTDVPIDDTFYTQIEWLASEGVTKGCNPPANDTFCPGDSVTRGQMAAFLHRALGDELTPGATPSFTDIAGSVFEADIEWLGSVGVTKGCNPPTNDQFCPDQVVTRGQMAAFLVRALGYTAGAGSDLFTDDDGSIFEADIERLAEAGVTRGCNPPVNDLFCPDDPVTRGQMAAFLYRALGG